MTRGTSPSLVPEVLRAAHTLDLASAVVTTLHAPPTDADWLTVRRAFFSTLNRVQRHKVPFPDNDEWLALADLADDDVHRAALRLAGGELPADAQGDDNQIRRAEVGIRAGLELIGQVDDDFAQSCRLIAGTFVLAWVPGLGAASARDLLGVIWLSPPSRWTPEEFAAAIAHESTHQVLFLADMIRRIFTRAPNEMEGADSLVLSAVRGQRRPYDQAFHAAFVAVVTRNLLDELGATGSEQYPSRERLARSIEELVDRAEGFLTPYGHGVLTELVHAASSGPGG